MNQKLFVSDDHCDMIVDQDDVLYAGVNGDSSIERAARARRIVACVNACAGISTENLEENLTVKELAHRYNKAKNERDELLAAVEECISAFELTRQYVGYETLPALRGWSWFDAVCAARAAIASVKGGAA